MRMIKKVKIEFRHWWLYLNPMAVWYKIKIERELNAALDRDHEKIVEHANNVALFGKCNGDCGCLVLHPNLKTANPPHNSQEPAKPSAGGQSQAKQ